jgi:hypothetical protein
MHSCDPGQSLPDDFDRQSSESSNFVRHPEFDALLRSGKLVQEDIVYGERYAIIKSSLEAILSGGRIALHEIHPHNLHAISAKVPTVSVLVTGPQHVGDAKRSARDATFEEDYPRSAFDFVVDMMRASGYRQAIDCLSTKLLSHSKRCPRCRERLQRRQRRDPPRGLGLSKGLPRRRRLPLSA